MAKLLTITPLQGTGPGKIQVTSLPYMGRLPKKNQESFTITTEVDGKSYSTTVNTECLGVPPMFTMPETTGLVTEGGKKIIRYTASVNVANFVGTFRIFTDASGDKNNDPTIFNLVDNVSMYIGTEAVENKLPAPMNGNAYSVPNDPGVNEPFDLIIVVDVSSVKYPEDVKLELKFLYYNLEGSQEGYATTPVTIPANPIISVDSPVVTLDTNQGSLSAEVNLDVPDGATWNIQY